MDDVRAKRVHSKGLRIDWKKKLKEVCVQRVQRERYQLLRRIRTLESTPGPSDKEHLVSAFQQIVSDEFTKLNQTTYIMGEEAIPDADNMVWEYEPSEAMSHQIVVKEAYEDLMISMERALYQDLEVELKEKEALLLEDYEKIRALEETSFVDLLEHAKQQQVFYAWNVIRFFCYSC
ncbi:hypothetical protein O6H91_10G108500 [Diphasiastrum complanatum]|uniref:Uncharacterized protein n=1 Tax=Diphasiastrum complanatum TaxID=34168 RepID=A0ACC2CKJ4_DIPCM|nr:hypothetical protein O6H91_10G108500 [Diphasiastrum complanatum]